MGGYDPVRVALPPPWEDFWIEAVEPSFADWIEYERLINEAAVVRTNEAVERPVALLLGCITAHNLTTPDGSPLGPLTFAALRPSQLGAIYQALYSLGGASGVPLTRSRATSRGRSSSATRRSRRSSGSGS